MKIYAAVLGRQAPISVAELESLFREVKIVAPGLAEFAMEEDSPRNSDGQYPDLDRLGGTLKIAEKIEEKIEDYLRNLPETGKITLGVSDFSRGTSAFLAQKEALRLKRLLTKSGRSVRVVPNKTAVLSSATSFHNHLFTETKIELLKYRRQFYRVIGVQNITAYTRRDRERPARDAKVGMLPPKLAQILINLCGREKKGAWLLDPFCGTGVVLQEAMLMGYQPYGTDVNERMIKYSERNLDWLQKTQTAVLDPNLTVKLQVGDARSFCWSQPIDAVACETYLGPPMSAPPAEIKLSEAKQECGNIIRGFLKNLAEQLKPGTPVVIAVPAWLRPDGHYERLNLLDEIGELRYNVKSFKNLGQNDLLYQRDGQVVAREIIVLRKI